MSQPDRPIAILYEHPTWFEPLFEELGRRAIPFERIDAGRLQFDPAARTLPYRAVFNRMSPSSWLRGNESALFATHAYLSYLDDLGSDVINGRQAWEYEVSKVRQLSLMARLGIRHPRTRVVIDPRDLPAAAAGFEFPVLFKPNVGGSGAGIESFDSPREMELAARSATLDFGPDATGLVQEQLPAKGNAVVRLEFLDGRLLYAIRLRLLPGSFNLCPADYCEPDGVDNGRPLIEAYQPPPAVVADAARLLAAAGADLGGVEYLTSERDDQVYFYDVNALSNFVADAPGLIGFDPTTHLVDFLEARLSRRHVAVAG